MHKLLCCNLNPLVTFVLKTSELICRVLHAELVQLQSFTNNACREHFLLKEIITKEEFLKKIWLSVRHFGGITSLWMWFVLTPVAEESERPSDNRSFKKIIKVVFSFYQLYTNTLSLFFLDVYSRKQWQLLLYLILFYMACVVA